MIDKEIGWTSFDVVNKIRVALRDYLGIRKIKVGHAGTLDPLASGLVIICTGKATKQIRQWQDLQKTYEAALKFGETTPSYDLETAVDHTLPWDHITREDFEKALERFTGEIDQVPPVFSAKSIGGKRAYNYARKGKTVELKPARVTINRLNILSYRLPEVKLMIECSKGTYIRALARDLGEALNSGAHLTALRRLQIGTHHVSDAMTVKNFEKRLKQM
ncbi:MAG: tRNA pseudouridine(55) synthase TruB [Bacteroidales bacterium]|nr:tRNA pseudouridine(55) synthase TruB [Bacteroidales bacterium]MBN2698360.1 tRNA pseudouridine(55) synthase TruB [Bacteroidales bacterium]